jgi:hypothetical protein
MVAAHPLQHVLISVTDYGTSALPLPSLQGVSPQSIANNCGSSRGGTSASNKKEQEQIEEITKPPADGSATLPS